MVSLVCMYVFKIEEGNRFPKVVASHLLSPSGPRFINLILHLAKHVMLKTMKTFTTGTKLSFMFWHDMLMQGLHICVFVG